MAGIELASTNVKWKKLPMTRHLYRPIFFNKAEDRNAEMARLPYSVARV